MPEFTLTGIDKTEALFPTDDPLTITLPDPDGGGPHVFVCEDVPMLPDDSSVSLDTRPRSYMIEAVCGQVAEADRRKVRDLMGQLFDQKLVSIDTIMEMLRWLNEQREAARKRLAKRVTGRPTGGPSPST